MRPTEATHKRNLCFSFTLGVGKLFTQRVTLEKNFEAEGHTDWKSKVKKKGHHDRRCPIFHSKLSEEQKKSSRPKMSYISQYQVLRNEIYIFVSARVPRKMVSRAVVCSPLIRAGAKGEPGPPNRHAWPLQLTSFFF